MFQCRDQGVFEIYFSLFGIVGKLFYLTLPFFFFVFVLTFYQMALLLLLLLFFFFRDENLYYSYAILSIRLKNYL